MKSSVMIIGVLTGLAFFANAMIPNSHAWPFLWPFLGGILVVFQAVRTQRDHLGFGHGVSLAAQTGLVSTLCCAVAGIVTLSLLARPELADAARAFGAPGVLPAITPVAAAVLAATVVGGGIIVSIIGGMLALPVSRLGSPSA